jgi:RNA polymerase sigma-70 factor, ECF subfamily
MRLSFVSTASSTALAVINMANMAITDPSDRDAPDLAACRCGDKQAIEQLFYIHKDRIYSIAYRFTEDPATAMDIAQDTFLKLMARIQDFRGEANFDSWLYRMVVNACLDHHRRKRRWLPLLEDLVSALPVWQSAPPANALDALLQEEAETQVRKSVAGLPGNLRIVVILRYTEGLSYEQIASVVDCPAGTVASRLNRAHKLLERRLSQRPRAQRSSS